MRGTRARQRDGFRVVPFEVHDREIAGLIKAGWLAEANRGNREAIARAIGTMFGQLYGASGEVATFPARPS